MQHADFIAAAEDPSRQDEVAYVVGNELLSADEYRARLAALSTQDERQAKE